MHESLLDTDILSEILKGVDASVVKTASEYRQLYGRFTTSVITVMEVVKGLHKQNREAEIGRFLRALSAEEVVEMDVHSAEVAGRVYAELERTGQPIGRADPMIAGMAIHHGLTLVTGNTGHYQRIIDLGFPLVIENWRAE